MRNWFSLLTRWLEDERRFWPMAALLLGLCAVMKGAQRPNLWSATQMQLDYSLGFIKRALLGEMMGLLHIPIHRYAVVVAVSWVFLLMLLAGLAFWAYRSGASRSIGHGAAVAVFASSFGLTYLTSMVGYLDILLMVLTLLAMCARSFGGALSAAVAVSTVGVFIHEIYAVNLMLLAFLPAILIASRTGQPLRYGLIAAALAGILALVTAIALRPSLSPELTAQLRDTIAARTDFALKDGFFTVLVTPFRENLAEMWAGFGNRNFWVNEILCLTVFGPAIVYFLWIAFSIIRAEQNPRRWIPLAATLVAGIAPLSAQAIGVDTYRWFAIATFTSFMAMTIVVRQYLAGRTETIGGAALRHISIVLIALNMASSDLDLMDGKLVILFPFNRQLRAMIDWALTGMQHPVF